jgi:hypothetical protein
MERKAPQVSRYSVEIEAPKPIKIMSKHLDAFLWWRLTPNEYRIVTEFYSYWNYTPSKKMLMYFTQIQNSRDFYKARTHLLDLGFIVNEDGCYYVSLKFIFNDMLESKWFENSGWDFSSDDKLALFKYCQFNAKTPDEYKEYLIKRQKEAEEQEQKNKVISLLVRHLPIEEFTDEAADW